jgi:hypothetical protein
MDTGLFCDRCARDLHPGRGDHYVVHIEAIADPAPPEIEPADPAELRRQIQRTLRALDDVSAQEAIDQVQRRLTLYLCNRCFREWIEKPVG